MSSQHLRLKWYFEKLDKYGPRLHFLLVRDYVMLSSKILSWARIMSEYTLLHDHSWHWLSSTMTHHFRLRIPKTYYVKQIVSKLCSLNGALSEQIWRNVALHHFLTNGYSDVNGCCQNSSRYFEGSFVSYKHSFSLYKMLIGGLEWCGLLVDYCVFNQLFRFWFWRHPFTAKDPLVSK